MPGTLPVADYTPIAHGGFGDAQKGTLGLSTDVCVKKLRLYANEDQEKVKEVLRYRNPLPNTRFLTNFEAALQGGCCVEALEPPKYCALQRCHVRSTPARFGVDAWWRAAGVYKEQFGRESD